MKIYKNIKSFNAVNPVLTVGAFDGVHIGHVKIIEQLNKAADENNSESVILTFCPHPRKLLFPEKPFKLLTTIEERTELIKAKNIDNLIIIPFTKEFSKKSSYDFIKDVVNQSLGAKKLIAGYDHRFGKDRLADLEKIREYASIFNIEVNKVEALNDSGINISSTEIRNALTEGCIEKANRYLGYNYFLKGKVVEGNKIGRTIGFPTANIKVSKDKLLPKNGVYSAAVKIAGKSYSGMLNIGNRPTISKNLKTSVEVHIFNFDKCIYGSEITISLIKHIRDEKKFDDIDLLRRQIKEDMGKILRG